MDQIIDGVGLEGTRNGIVIEVVVESLAAWFRKLVFEEAIA